MEKRHLRQLLPRLLGLVVCFILISVVAIRRDGTWLGYNLNATHEGEARGEEAVQWVDAEGVLHLRTTQLGGDIIGFAGPVPLEITLRDGVIERIMPLAHSETPSFFRRTEVLFSQWEGKSLAEASRVKVDVISGATFTSRAIIGNMERGLAYAQRHSQAVDRWYSDIEWSLQHLAGLLVVLAGALVPLWVKNRRYRIVQQLLDVGVLGFWCGAFISYSSLVGYASHGVRVTTLLVPLMLVIAFIYPLFGKKQHYCHHLCPFGAAQELASRCSKRKWRLGERTVKRLNAVRQVIWVLLMLCLWTGVWFTWVDYEPFSAFLLQSSSWVVWLLAGVFVVLSVFVPRAYCRFVCPVGTLFQVGEGRS